MANLRYPEDYHTYFDSKTYLDLFYTDFKRDENEDGSVLPFMKAFHEFWSVFTAPKDMKVRYLEFGGGPSIANLIFSCPKVDQIVFAEYTEANRQAVKSWVDSNPEVVLELEAKNADCPAGNKDKLASVAHRASEIKRKIKSIIPCDVTKNPIVQFESDDVGKPFDVVTSSLCLEACVSSEEHYKNAVAELCKLLKPNGYLLMNGVMEQTFYFVGKEKFYTFPLTEKLVKEAMNEAGIQIEKFVPIPVNYTEMSDCKSLFYAYGKKCAQN